MCYGTAPSEKFDSWCFFLINVRQVLIKFCPEVNVWGKIPFMSDRHPAIKSAIEKHFPNAHHLYCAVHILRNVNVRGINVYQFWQAVEAICEEDFKEACSRASTPKIMRLMDEAKHWSRFAIMTEGCRRYGIRTNNYAESQNSALLHERTAPVMLVLFEALCYTAAKVSKLRRIAAGYRKSGGNYFTDHAVRVYRSNMAMARSCSVEQYSTTSYMVTEFGKQFHVDIYDENNMTCSCHRFFDEEIACQHILKVIDKFRMKFLLTSLIRPIYDQSSFIEAFPDKLGFFPKDHNSYEQNLNVVRKASSEHQRLGGTSIQEK